MRSSDAAWDDTKLRAFALWCAHENMVEDTEAPHGEAFSAGYDAGAEDGMAALNEFMDGGWKSPEPTVVARYTLTRVEEAKA